MADNVLRFDFLARDRASQTFQKIGKESDTLGTKIGRFGKFVGTAMIGVGTALGGVAAAGAVVGVKTAASLEQAQIGFATLLHSGQKAQVFLQGLTKFAASTPFELKGLVDSSRTLIGVGLNTKQTMKILQDFGDTASAVGIGQDSFQRIMLATSQAISAGKFMTADLNQIANNGIPVWVILSKSMHKTVPELRDLASHGKLLSKDVLPALQAEMHKDYGGAMAKQSQTLNGLWSTFTDTLSLGLAKAITPMIPALKTGLAGASVIAGKALEKLPGILDTMTAAFKTSKDFVLNTVVPGFKTAFSKIGDKLPKIDISGLGATFQDQAKDWGGLIILGVKTGMQTGNWGELGKVLGEGLTKAVTSGATGAGKLAGAVGKWISGVDWEEVGQSAGKTAFPFIIGFTTTMFDGIITAAKEHPLDTALFVVSFIGLGKLFAAFRPLRALLEALPFGKWVGKALDMSAAPVFDAVWRLMRWFGRFFMEGFRAADGMVGGEVSRFIRGITGGIAFQARVLGSAVMRFLEGIPLGAGRMAGRIAFTVRQVIGWLVMPYARAGGWLIRRGSELIVGLARGIGSMAGVVGRAAGNAIRWVVRPFGTAASWLFQAGRQVLRGLRDGMINGVQAAGSWARSIGGRIVSAVKGFFGIKSPSKVFAGIGKNLITSLFGSMIDHNPVRVITKIFGGMPQALGALVDKGMVKISALPGRAMSALSGLGGKFAGMFGGLFGGGGGGGGGNAQNRALGQIMARVFGWGSGAQWKALNSLIMSESGWNNRAQNPTSSAYGIGQFLDGTWGSMGMRKTSDPAAQIGGMLRYVQDRYGDPLSAWAFKRAHNWYGSGGYFARPQVIGVGERGPERLLNARETRGFERLVQAQTRGGGGGGDLNVNIYATGSDIDLENRIVKVVTNAKRYGRLK